MAWEPRENVVDAPDIDEAVIYAFRALFTGTANQGQQQTVVAWLQYVCGDKDQSFRLGGEDGRRASDFAEGKRWVYAQIDHLMSVAALDRAKKIELAKIAKSKTKDR